MLPVFKLKFSSHFHKLQLPLTHVIRICQCNPSLFLLHLCPLPHLPRICFYPHSPVIILRDFNIESNDLRSRSLDCLRKKNFFLYSNQVTYLHEVNLDLMDINNGPTGRKFFSNSYHFFIIPSLLSCLFNSHSYAALKFQKNKFYKKH